MANCLKPTSLREPVQRIDGRWGYICGPPKKLLGLTLGDKPINRNLATHRKRGTISGMGKVSALFLLTLVGAPTGLTSQTSGPDQTLPDSSSTTTLSPDFGRPVSWKLLLPNILGDQKRVWLFPLQLRQKNNWIPTTIVLGATAGLAAVDTLDGPYFRRTESFHGFNQALTGNATSLGILIAPVSLYVAGLVRHDSKMKGTTLLAAEAVVDSEIVTTVFKGTSKRVRPAALPSGSSSPDTWFDSKGTFLGGGGSFPSGHTVEALSVATVFARRYGNHRWVPYVAYGLAAVVGLSGITLSAHFVSDVFMGGALGYSISRFAVGRQ
jgi:membrane-associated phospholipid phosphatase